MVKRPARQPARRIPQQREPEWRPWLAWAALVAVSLVAYMPAWHGGLLWDDDGHVTRSALRSMSGLWRIWSEAGATQQYYPVLHSVFWGLHRLWGDQTFGYHLVNIILHGTSAFLFVVILRRLRVPGAVLAGVIFALHPVHVESVAWITELKNTLSGVWYLCAALVYLRFDERRAPRLYGVALLLFVLALLSKSVTATLPAALLVVFWWQRGTLRWREDIRPLVPFFVLGVTMGLGTAWIERALIGASGPAFNFTLVERVLIAGRALWFYLSSIVWPTNFIFVYPRWDVSQDVWWQYLFPAAALLVVGALWRLRTRTRAPLAVALLFGGTLFPALGFFNVYPFIFSLVADHFQYLASLSVIALGSAGIAMAYVRWAPRDAWVAPALLIVVAGGLGSLTWRQSQQYESADTLYKTTIARNPNAWMAHLNLGWLRLQRGELESALRDTQAALSLEPNLPQGHNNLGSALRGLGRFEEAARAFREALRLRPDNSETRYNLGLALIDLGRPDEARTHIAAYLAVRPDDAQAHGQLGDVLQSLGRPDEAIAAYRAAIRLNPRSARLHINLGAALGQQGRNREAIAEFTEALRLDPGNAMATQNLAIARARLGPGGGRPS